MVTGWPENPCLNSKSMLGLGPISAEAIRKGRKDDNIKSIINMFLRVLVMDSPFLVG
jgi:hypothetical protein